MNLRLGRQRKLPLVVKLVVLNGLALWDKIILSEVCAFANKMDKSLALVCKGRVRVLSSSIGALMETTE